MEISSRTTCCSVGDSSRCCSVGDSSRCCSVGDSSREEFLNFNALLIRSTQLFSPISLEKKFLVALQVASC